MDVKKIDSAGEKSSTFVTEQVGVCGSPAYRCLCSTSNKFFSLLTKPTTKCIRVVGEERV